MSKRALEFVETWVSERIYPEDSPPQVDVSAAKALAASCRAAANAAGISDAEIEEQFDNLTAFIAGQIEERLINYRQRMTNARRSKRREAPSGLIVSLRRPYSNPRTPKRAIFGQSPESAICRRRCG